ncbi:hypothetical protein [Streptomyces sp. WAC 06738]|uniref:hypothetical protein n=1 Tax=Streptomyces sp. WAC 06738 TaxID=2203210 RepID=UPI001F0BEB67|nr:hypothetical protein [Streptomyces sp. WAC 06738]
MTGHYPAPVPPPAAAPPAPPPAAPRSGRRRLVPAVLAAVLVAGAAATGVVVTALKVQDADRGAGSTDVWQKPEERGLEGDAAKDPGVAAPPGGPIGDALLPMPTGYHPGPDIDEFGNDTVLTAKQAEAVYEQSARGLPPDQRRLQLDALDDLELKGMAMRSYAADESDLVVEVQLAELSGEGKAAGLAAVQEELTRTMDLFEEGPKVDGHKSAACFLVPETALSAEGDAVKMMTCSAAKGEMLVTVTAYGPAGHGKRAVQLLEKQLDHIDAPGKSI